jgi:hypothetical protein
MWNLLDLSQGELLFLRRVEMRYLRASYCFFSVCGNCNFSGRVIASLLCVEFAFLLGWLLFFFSACETAFLQGVMLRFSVRPSG